MFFYLFGITILAAFIWFRIKDKNTEGISLSISLIIGLIFSASINLLLGPVTCKSGWRSPSIGSRGACSHHGGVEDRSWVFFLFVIIVFFSWLIISDKFRKNEEKKVKKERELFENAIKTKIKEKIPINDWKEKNYLLNIATREKLAISFSYTDKYNHKYKRCVTPIAIKWGCLISYCHLKKAERNFRISRMNDLIIEKTLRE